MPPLLSRLLTRIEEELRAGERRAALDTCYVAADLVEGMATSSSSSSRPFATTELVLCAIERSDDREKRAEDCYYLFRTMAVLMVLCGSPPAPNEGRGMLRILLAHQERRFAEGKCSGLELMHTKLAHDVLASWNGDHSRRCVFPSPSPESLVSRYSTVGVVSCATTPSLLTAIKRYQTHLSLMESGDYVTAGEQFEALGDLEAAGVCYGASKSSTNVMPLLVEAMRKVQSSEDNGVVVAASDLNRLLLNVAQASLARGDVEGFRLFRTEAERWGVDSNAVLREEIVRIHHHETLL